MSTRSRIPRVVAAALVASIALTGLAPVARAGHGDGDGHKVRGPGRGPWGLERMAAPGRTVIVRHGSSDVAPMLAGLIGGFVLGTAVSHAAPPVEVRTVYWDPYCDERFVSLDRYEWHLRHHHHPYLARVIDERSGACLGTELWRDGGWCDADACRGHDEGWRYEDRDGDGREDGR